MTLPELIHAAGDNEYKDLFDQITLRDAGYGGNYGLSQVAWTGFDLANEYVHKLHNAGNGGGTIHALASDESDRLRVNDDGVFADYALTLPFMTQGAIPFAGTGGLITSDPTKLFYDDANDRFGLLISDPTTTLDINHRFNVVGATGALTMLGDLVVGASKMGVTASTGDISTLGSVAANLGALTDPKTIFGGSATWNDVNDNFYGLFLSITDSNSAVLSYLLDFQVGGASRFTIDKRGALTIALPANATTTNYPILKGTATWNHASLVGVGLLLNITDTASAAASLLADWQIAGVSKASIGKTGMLTLADIGRFMGNTTPTTGVGVEVGYNAGASLGYMIAIDRAGTTKKLWLSGSEVVMAEATSQKVGFYGNSGATQQSLAADAADLATALTLVNDLKSKLRNLGLFA